VIEEGVGDEAAPAQEIAHLVRSGLSTCQRASGEIDIDYIAQRGHRPSLVVVGGVR
jgi:hypothetical protein